MPTSTRNKVETGLRRGSAARIVGRRGGEERAFNFFSIRERKRSIFQGNKEPRGGKGSCAVNFFYFAFFQLFQLFYFSVFYVLAVLCGGKTKRKGPCLPSLEMGVATGDKIREIVT